MTQLHHRVRIDVERSVQEISSQQQRIGLPEDFGYCYADTLQIEAGLLLNQLHYCPQYALEEETQATHPKPVMVLTVGLQGCSKYQSKNTEQLSFKTDHISINTFPSIEGIRHYQKQQTVSQLRLIMTSEFLSKYLSSQQLKTLFFTNHIHPIAFQPVSMTTKVHACALAHSLSQRNNQPQHSLQQHIHALSLLSEHLPLIVPDESTVSPANLSMQDVQNLEKAKALMINQLDQALTMQYIASVIGMNVYKFKACFIKLYGVNPTEYLLQLRMQQAHSLLESGLHVAQVAWKVGYQYPNNFTVAFTRFYGKSPKALFAKNKSK